MNFPDTNCFHKLQFCTNCFRGGLFHGVIQEQAAPAWVPYLPFMRLVLQELLLHVSLPMGSLLQEQAAAPKNLHRAEVLIQYNKAVWGGKVDQHACWKRGEIFPK